MSKHLLVLALTLFLTTPLFAQSVDTAWVRRYNGPGNDADYATAMAIDDSGNVYVTGRSNQSTYPGYNYDYTTIKYYPNGDTAWARRYNGPGNWHDYARAIAVDRSGNVCVTGYSWGSGTEEDYATIKYYPNGDTAWVRRYGSPEGWSCEDYYCYDYAYDIAVDSSSNVYVTGGIREWDSEQGWTDNVYCTIKYSPNGDIAWERRYYSERGDHCAYAIAVDDLGNVYVTGWSDGIGTGPDYATIKYGSMGNFLWVARYNGPANRDDCANALAVDDSGNVYVTGWSVQDSIMYPYKYDYATIKYYPNGDTSWVRRYNGPGNGDDYAYAIAVDKSGNAYVTGYSRGSGTGPDYATIKYDPNGNELWVRRYNGPGGPYIGGDIATAIALDSFGNIYVTGYSYDSYGWNYVDYATIKYYPNGDTTWVRRYSGLGGGYPDYASAISVDGSNNVYVTGGSYGEPAPGSNLDYATIKYVQSPFIRGDANGDGKVTVSDVVFLINYLFKGGTPPNPVQVGDANCDGKVTVSDVIYLINYLFKGGPPPC